MPLIEELPVTNSHSRPSHGWTYVADNTSGTPVPTAPLKSRKRGRDGGGLANPQAAHRLSAKQEKAIQQRLSDLGKENHRDVHIPIPKREGGRAGKERKATANVRRILAYSRTFQHYLADEEAGVNVYGSAGIVPASVAAGSHGGQASVGRADPKKRGGATEPVPSQKAAAKKSASLKHAATTTTTTLDPSTPVKKETSDGGGDAGEDVKMNDAPALTSPPDASTTKSPTTTAQKSPQQDAAPQTSPPSQTPTSDAQQYDPALDRDPLLKTLDLPKMPSDRLMAALLAEPPLSYNAARARPLNAVAAAGPNGSNLLLARPPRYFCPICGYWGKVRCKQGCGERVCGLLECWRAHEAVCSLGAY